LPKNLVGFLKENELYNKKLFLNKNHMEGTIKNITDKGFGFITVEGQDKDLFFHRNELQGVAFEDLKVGDRLSFEMSDSPKGPNATNITRI